MWWSGVTRGVCKTRKKSQKNKSHEEDRYIKKRDSRANLYPRSTASPALVNTNICCVSEIQM